MEVLGQWRCPDNRGPDNRGPDNRGPDKGGSTVLYKSHIEVQASVHNIKTLGTSNASTVYSETLLLPRPLIKCETTDLSWVQMYVQL